MASPSWTTGIGKQRFRPNLEILADRCVPAILTVKNLADDGSAGCLRSVIAAANDLPDADTIVFKAGLEGTIVLNGTQIDINENLTIQGPGASKVAVSGNFASRIFNIYNNIADLTVNLSGLELRHGVESGNGGAIRCEENLKLNRMAILFNEGVGGGGVYCELNLTVTKCTIAGNRASADGGGISAGPVTITASSIFDNTAGASAGGVYCNSGSISTSMISGNVAAFSGGGIRCQTSATITNCTISRNRAGTFGGGLAGQGATVSGCTISGNVADHGGGIGVTQATIQRTTISGNTANSAGGGIYFLFDAGTNEVSNSTISGNRAATQNGGGIYCRADLNLRNSTIAFNASPAGGGGGIFITGSTPFLESCLVANNAASAGKDLDGFMVADFFHLDHCLISVDDGLVEVRDFGSVVIVPSVNPGTNLFGVDPRLAPLASNGGKTQTHKLKKGSPAINAGSNSSGLTTDQRGPGFRRKLGSAVDIGAFERQ